MAATRRGQPALSVRLPQPASLAVLPDLPPISALFLIDFDVKAGYTIVWKRAVPGLELEGVVEYKSLPSGLHTVTEDLVYFAHDTAHAGLSAFVNERTEEEATRHARMIAVGVLVPLSYGRLGRAWRHAPALKEMASALATDGKKTQLLEQYWKQNGARETSVPQPLKPMVETPVSSPALSFKSARPGQRGHTRNRSASDGGALIPPGHRLSPYHPAWSLTSLLDTFGPLIFPIHRAALLRKRILISTHAPVHEPCNFVYDISVLSNIPLSVCDVVDPAASVVRLRPLFNIGVHDISYLLEHQEAMRQRNSPERGRNDDDSAVADESASGWVACTTDSILAMKENLWDMLITMPAPYSSGAKERAWPNVECPKGVPIKATQRDLRRFRSLKTGLARLAALSSSNTTQPTQNSSQSPHLETTEVSAPGTSGAIRLSRSPTRPSTCPEEGSRRSLLGDDDEAEKIVEPTTWAALAYSGFMWWASAGEQRGSDEVDEQAHDGALLADLAPHGSSSTLPQRRASFGAPLSAGLVDSVSSLTARRVGEDGYPSEDQGDDEERAGIELAIIAYFHRLTTVTLGVLADIVDSSDDDDLLGVDFDAAEDEDSGEDAGLLRPAEDGDSSGWVRVDSEALAQMGLDVWSKADADFVRELMARYFGRRAYVENKGVEVCGLRVC
ncbi:hypothetical protein B0T14DRAFT_516635 [Immersiella caudata]|uniref:DUF4484 domain-containing protein n=1 Tax=Immersiella caudata TaxID=314043 RepID=A0AA39WXR7_9PEZI|nr:hypothetical protein B0T14DRAFT_516635 [Immersiella caudata]